MERDRPSICIKDIQTLARDKGKMMSVKFEQRRRDGSWRAYACMALSICCFNIGWIAEKMKKSQKSSPIDIEPSYGMTSHVRPWVSKPSTPSSG
jgi:hypothetical protein